jgi:hypothetical protein
MMTFPLLVWFLSNAARDKMCDASGAEPSRYPDKCEEAENESSEGRSVPKPIQQSAHSPMNRRGRP